MVKDLTPVPSPKGDGCLLAKVNALRELLSATGEELRPFFGRTLLPSVLRPSGGAFKGEL